MTKAQRPRPWHEIVRLKAAPARTADRRALAEFAADLHEVTLARGRRPVYEDPEKFFALTYPTHALHADGADAERETPPGRAAARRATAWKRAALDDLLATVADDLKTE